MSTDVLGYLHSKGIQTKPATKNNVHCPCVFCGEAVGKRGRLYINVDQDAEIPGLFYCQLCGEKGSLKKIQRFYGDDPGDGKDPGVAHYDLMRAAASYYHKALNARPDIVGYLRNDRGLTRDTIVKFKLGWADGKVVPHLKSLGFTDDECRTAGFVTHKGHEFFDGVITIPYYVGGTCTGIRQKELTGKYKQPSGFTQRIFNVDAARTADEIVITEGEFDCMVAEQLGYAAIGVPGATQWQESWNSYVRDAKRVWVVFDNDEAGRKGADKIREIIGPRAKALTIPGSDDDGNDITDWIVKQGHTGEEFGELLHKHKGSLLITVAEAMTEWESVQGKDGLKFNFEYLDRIIAPGLLPGQVVVTLAKTNTGKTIWLENTFEMMAQLDDNLTFLFLSLEQTRGEWFERAQRIYAFHHLDIAPDSDAPEAIAEYGELIRQRTHDWWSPRLMLTDKNRMTLDHICMTLDDYKQEMGRLPSVLAIDYLGYLARAFPGKDKYEKTSEAIMSVKEIGKDYEIPVLMPHQVSRSGQFGHRMEIDVARDSGAVEETADIVFVLWNPDHGKEAHEQKTGRINMQIGKSRSGGKGDELYYAFAPRTLAMIPGTRTAGSPDRGLEIRALDELNFPAEPWHMAMYRHRTGRRS